uniref:Uncharacterized protein n=1 Tax=Arcella intermedia TaxID=1963864 RepID=A0A6B2LLN1_9EUKA
MFHFSNHFNFHSNPQRQCISTNCRPSMFSFLPKDINKKIRSPIDNLRSILKILHTVHNAKEFHNPHLVQIPNLVLQGPNQSKSNRLCSSSTLLNTQVPANLSSDKMRRIIKMRNLIRYVAGQEQLIP